MHLERDQNFQAMRARLNVRNVDKDRNVTFDEIQSMADFPFDVYFGLPSINSKKAEDSVMSVSDVPSSAMLRALDEEFAHYYHLPIPRRTPPLMYPPEIPIRVFPRGQFTGKDKNDSLVYFSRGLEEYNRIRRHVHGKVSRGLSSPHTTPDSPQPL
jgi:hypothetical protein